MAGWRVSPLTDSVSWLCYAPYSKSKQARSEATMFGGLLFIVCVILQFHYHDSIPWYIWVLALIAQFAALGEPAIRMKKN